jgi:hypothetical protein
MFFAQSGCITLGGMGEGCLECMEVVMATRVLAVRSDRVMDNMPRGLHMGSDRS